MYGERAYVNHYANQKEVLKELALKAKDFTNQRAYRNQPLSEQDTRTKRTQSQTRAKVEHPFLTLKHIWGHAQGGLSGLAQERQAGVCDAGLDP